MEGKCEQHKEDFNYYCLICKKGFCTSCYLEEKACQNQRHKEATIDYEMFLYGCCEKHFKKFIGGCTLCNRAWCLSCIQEKSNCLQQNHRTSISNYLEYKKYLDKNMEKYNLIQERPIQEHLNYIQAFMKQMKDESIHKNRNEYNLEVNFKYQFQQIYSELKRNTQNYKQSFSMVLKKIFNSSLIIRTTQRVIRNAQIKAKIFNIEQNKIHEKMNKCVKDLKEIHYILDNELKSQFVFDGKKNEQEKRKNMDINSNPKTVIKKAGTSYLFDILDFYNKFLIKFEKGKSSNFMQENPFLNLISIIKQFVTLYPLLNQNIDLASNQQALETIPKSGKKISDSDKPNKIELGKEYQWTPFLFYLDGGNKGKLHLQNSLTSEKFITDFNEKQCSHFRNIEQYKNYLFITYTGFNNKDASKTCQKLYLEKLPNFQLSSSYMNVDKGNATLISSDFYLLSFGGNNHDGDLKTCEIYNEKKDNWKIVSPLNRPDQGITAVFITSSIIFTFGGKNNHEFEQCFLNSDGISSPGWIMLFVRNRDPTIRFEMAFPLNENEILIFNGTRIDGVKNINGLLNFQKIFYDQVTFSENNWPIFSKDNPYVANPYNFFIFNIKEQILYEKDKMFAGTLNSNSKPKKINDEICFIAQISPTYYCISELAKANLTQFISKSIKHDLFNKLESEYYKMDKKMKKQSHHENPSNFDNLEKERQEMLQILKQYPNSTFENIDGSLQMKIYIYYQNLREYFYFEYSKNLGNRLYKIFLKSLTWNVNELEF